MLPQVQSQEKTKHHSFLHGVKITPGKVRGQLPMTGTKNKLYSVSRATREGLRKHFLTEKASQIRKELWFKY